MPTTFPAMIYDAFDKKIRRLATPWQSRLNAFSAAPRSIAHVLSRHGELQRQRMHPGRCWIRSRLLFAVRSGYFGTCSGQAAVKASTVPTRLIRSLSPELALWCCRTTPPKCGMGMSNHFDPCAYRCLRLRPRQQAHGSGSCCSS